MIGWKEVQLGNIATLEYGKGLPERNRVPGDFPVYGSGGIIGFHEKYYVNTAGIIIGRKGSIGTVYYSDKPFFPIDTVFYINRLNGEFNLKFYYYYLSNIGLENLNSDAAVPGLNRNWVHNLKAKLPPLPIQKKIAAVLSAYDDLIENNNRRIAILEKMAEEIYREWFVRMRFPGHEKVRFHKGVPEGWEITKLGDLLELAYGKALKEGDRIPGDYPVYGSSGIVGAHKQYLVKGPCIIVGRKGNVGSVNWSEKDFFPIDTVYYVISDISFYFLFYLLQNLNFINNDAAVPGLNRKQAYSNKFYLPFQALIDKFDKIIKKFFNYKNKLSKKNMNLTKSRDLLLSRLLSGKLSVENLDIKFPPGMEETDA